jgi:hypothetical protein
MPRGSTRCLACGSRTVGRLPLLSDTRHTLPSGLVLVVQRKRGAVYHATFLDCMCMRVSIAPLLVLMLVSASFPTLRVVSVNLPSALTGYKQVRADVGRCVAKSNNCGIERGAISVTTIGPYCLLRRMRQTISSSEQIMPRTPISHVPRHATAIDEGTRIHRRRAGGSSRCSVAECVS